MKAPRKKRKPDKRINLAPLTFEEVLEALLKTPPPPKESQPPGKARPASADDVVVAPAESEAG